MADTLYIANGALSLVGQGIILSLGDNTPAAKYCTLHMSPAVRETLAEGKWKSAKGKASLGQLTAAPAFGYSYQYQLPDDFVRMITFNDVDPDNLLRPLYDIQGKQLLTDETTAQIDYVKDLMMAGNDISAAHPKLVQAMVLNLAAKLAWPMQQSRTLQENLEQRYVMALRKALSVDAKQTRNVLPNPAAESSWLRARQSSTNG